MGYMYTYGEDLDEIVSYAAFLYVAMLVKKNVAAFPQTSSSSNDIQCGLVLDGGTGISAILGNYHHEASCLESITCKFRYACVSKYVDTNAFPSGRLIARGDQFKKVWDHSPSFAKMGPQRAYGYQVCREAIKVNECKIKVDHLNLRGMEKVGGIGRKTAELMRNLAGDLNQSMKWESKLAVSTGNLYLSLKYT